MAKSSETNPNRAEAKAIKIRIQAEAARGQELELHGEFAAFEVFSGNSVSISEKGFIFIAAMDYTDPAHRIERLFDIFGETTGLERWGFRRVMVAFLSLGISEFFKVGSSTDTITVLTESGTYQFWRFGDARSSKQMENLVRAGKLAVANHTD